MATLRSQRPALAAALAICLAAGAGCVMDPSLDRTDAPSMSSETAAAPTALRDQQVTRNGIPPGCTREWSEASMDSVLYCPDIAPPRIHQGLQ